VNYSPDTLDPYLTSWTARNFSVGFINEKMSKTDKIPENRRRVLGSVQGKGQKQIPRPTTSRAPTRDHRHDKPTTDAGARGNSKNQQNTNKLEKFPIKSYTKKHKNTKISK
jgi:hypothetical protein